jgi:hypothetical protein
MLLGEGTSVGRAEMERIHRELQEELRDLAGRIRSPGAAVLEPGLLWSARELSEAYAELAGRVPLSPTEELRRWVNLEYALSVALLEHLKLATSLPRVPRRRAPSPG